MKLGLILKEIRKKQGLTCVWVSEQSNISRQALNRIEKGDDNMNLNTFFRLCNALKISPIDLLKIKEKELESPENVKISDEIKKIVPEMSGTEAEFQTPLRASLPRKSQTA